MLFATILKNLREDKDLNQEDIAKFMNVDRSTVGKWESIRNPSKPDSEKLIKLADYFNVSIDYLLGRTDYKNPTNKEPELTKRDERDISKHLEKTLDLLEQQDEIMFDGEAMDEETKELLRQSLENSMRMAKAINKKYTPKKYRK